LLGLRPPHRFSWNSDRIAPVPGSVMSGKAVRMSPRQQSTSRKHAEGNADYAVEQRPPLTISTGISPANQQHQSKDQDFSPVNSGGELHLRARQSVNRHHEGCSRRSLPCRKQRLSKDDGLCGTRTARVFLFDITYEADREANLNLVTKLVEGRRQHFQIEKRYRRKDGARLRVRNNISLVPGSGNVPPSLFAVVEDITGRKNGRGVARK
jgi:hypothetical protein